MSIEFYIMSRGKAPEQDYKWIYLTGKEQEIKQPPELSGGQINKLIYREAFSLFIGRYGQRLILQVTGLVARSQDYQQRSVRNSLLCIGTSGDEITFRRIAVAALEDRLETILDEAISFIPTEPGFAARPELRTSLLEEQPDIDSHKNQDVAQQIGKNTRESRLLIARQLKEHCLPKQDGPLVVITNFISLETFKSAHVWLGLSDLIDDDIDNEHHSLVNTDLKSISSSPAIHTHSKHLSATASTSMQRLLHARITRAVALAIALLLATTLLNYFVTSHNVHMMSIRATAVVKAHVQATRVAATATVQVQLTATAVTQSQEDDVRFIDGPDLHSPGPSVKTGKSITLHVVAQNTGQSVWSGKEDYQLVCVNPKDSDCQQAQKIPMAEDKSTPPGDQYSFTITINTQGQKGDHWVVVCLSHGQKQFGKEQTLYYTVTQ